MEMVQLLRHERNGCHIADDIFTRIFLIENYCILIKISQKFVPKRTIDSKSTLIPLGRRQAIT